MTIAQERSRKAVDEQTKRRQRAKALFEHQQRIAGKCTHGTEYEKACDDLDLDFRLIELGRY